MKRNTLFILCFLPLVFSCHSKNPDSVTTIIATNSWTAAYAELAGAEKVLILAPFEMVHPSEYELRPSDISKIMNAKLIIYAGYEIMTEQLRNGLDLSEEKLLQIKTGYRYENIEKSVMNIAVRLGTEDIARENLLKIDQSFKDARRILQEKNMSNLTVLVHFHHSSLIKELGLTAIASFGPDTPELQEISQASKMQPALILDNFHNPVGQSLSEVLPDADYEQLINFPGPKGTKTLIDVIRYNVSRITSSF